MVYNADRNFGICVFLQIWREFTMDELRKAIIDNLEIIDRSDILEFINIIVKNIVEDEYGEKSCNN